MSFACLFYFTALLTSVCGDPPDLDGEVNPNDLSNANPSKSHSMCYKCYGVSFQSVRAGKFRRF